MVSDFMENATQLALINVNLGERYDFWVPFPEVYGYFWTWDGSALGYVLSDFQTIVLIDMESGQIVQHALSAATAQCLREKAESMREYYPYPFVYDLGIARNVPPEEENFLCFPFYIDKPYHIDYDHSGGNLTAYVTDQQTGNSIEIVLEDQEHKRYFTAANVQDSTIAVMQNDLSWVPEDERQFYESVDDGNRIVAWDLSTGEEIASFDGNFMSIFLSPDGQMIFTWESYRSCLLEIESGQMQYIENMNSEYSNLSDTAQWSLDSTQLHFLQKSEGGRLDMCIYAIPSGSISCPTQTVAELVPPTFSTLSSPSGLERHQVLGDGQAFLFSYGCMGCEFGAFSAVILRDGTHLYYLGQEFYDPGLTPYTYPFDTVLLRPTP